MRRLPVLALLPLLLSLAACGETDPDPGTATTASDDPSPPQQESTTSTIAAPDEAADSVATASSTFEAEVWADNWFALYVNGELVGEDSVPITTERSFNSETITFDADYPLTVAIEAKDFKEDDSGLENIGQPNQQMGDGGLIAQFTDTATGEIVAVTDGSWSTLVVHRAPLNPGCESDADPLTTCQSEIVAVPDEWVAADFDDSGWSPATIWSAAAVSPRDGYEQLSWSDTAELVWGADLEIDNTVLLRTTID